MSTQFGGSEASVTETMENNETTTTGTAGSANTGDNMTRVYHSRSVVGGRRPFRAAGRIRPEGVSITPQVEVISNETATDETTMSEGNTPVEENIIENETPVNVQQEVPQMAVQQPMQQAAPQPQMAVQQAAPQPQMVVQQPIQQAVPQPQMAMQQPMQQAAPQPQMTVQPDFPVDLMDADLINRIDEFRSQAQALQDMISAREAQAKELEARNRQLQNDYANRQNSAIGIANGMEDQLDQMIETLRIDMQDMEQNINASTAAKITQSIQQTEGLRVSLEEIKQKLSEPLDGGAIMDTLEEIKQKLDTPEQGDNSEIMASLDEIKKSVASSDDEDLKESFEDLTKAVTTSKNEILDSVHTENVKVFRNIQDLIKEDKSGEELELSLEVWYRIIKRRLSITMTIMIINMGLACVLILAILGVI